MTKDVRDTGRGVSTNVAEIARRGISPRHAERKLLLSVIIGMAVGASGATGEWTTFLLVCGIVATVAVVLGCRAIRADWVFAAVMVVLVFPQVPLSHGLGRGQISIDDLLYLLVPIAYVASRSGKNGDARTTLAVGLTWVMSEVPGLILGPIGGSIETRTGLLYLMRMLQYCLVGWLASKTTTGPRNQLLRIEMLLWVGFIEGVFGVAQTMKLIGGFGGYEIGYPVFGFHRIVPRAIGTMPDPYEFAGVLALCLGALLAKWKDFRRVKWLWMLGLLAGIVASASRASVGVAAIELIWWAAVSEVGVRARRLWGVVTCGALGTAMAERTRLVHRITRLFGEKGCIYGVLRIGGARLCVGGSLGHRLFVRYPQGLHVWAAHVLFGGGLSVVGPGLPSEYITDLANGGIAAFVGVVLVLALIWRRGGVLGRMAVITMAVDGIFYASMYSAKIAYVFWLLAGIAMAGEAKAISAARGTPQMRIEDATAVLVSTERLGE